MDTRIARFHSVRLPTAGTLIAYEPVRSCFVWVELRIPLRLRGSGCARRMVSTILAALPGTHYIDFDPAIRSFAEIAKRRRWKQLGESAWFKGCVSYKVRSRSLSPLPSEEQYFHRTYKRCPAVTSFRSDTALQRCLASIQHDIETMACKQDDA